MDHPVYLSPANDAEAYCSDYTNQEKEAARQRVYAIIRELKAQRSGVLLLDRNDYIFQDDLQHIQGPVLEIWQERVGKRSLLFRTDGHCKVCDLAMPPSETGFGLQWWRNVDFHAGGISSHVLGVALELAMEREGCVGVCH